MDAFNDIAIWVPAVSALIPLLGSLAVRQDGSNVARVVVAVVASVLLAVANQFVEDPAGAAWEALLVTAITAFVVQAAFYVGLWTHANTNDRILPTVGIGPKTSGE